MIAIGFVCIVIGYFIIRIFGTTSLYATNFWDYTGGTLVLSGMLSMVTGVAIFLWRHAP